MENKIIKIIVLLVLSTSLFAQKNKQDTLKMFEGHWVFKMAINTDYTPQELEDTYLKDVRSGKIHIMGNRIYGNFYGRSYINSSIEISNISINSGQKYLDNEFSKKELERMTSMGIVQDRWINISEKNTYYESLPFGYLILLPKQRYLIDGMDQTAFFLECDKAEYKFINVKETTILREDISPTLNKVLENEEVEVIEKGEQYTKIRYWGKALIIGWVKTSDLKDQTEHPEYWNIYKDNSIHFKIITQKSFISNDNFQKTNQYLMKGDTVEILEEKGHYLKIRYNNIIGLIPRADVEGYNKFRISKSKVIIHSLPHNLSKMYLLKGDDVELIERDNDWMKIRFRGKRVVEGWIKKSDVE